MVDPENVGLDEGAVQDPIQGPRRDEVVAKGFLDHHAASFRAPRSSELFHDGSEERGGDRQVVGGMRRVSELASQRLEGCRVPVVAVDVAKQARQLGERGPVQAAVLLDALLRPRAQLVEGPAGLGDTDDRYLELSALRHRLQRGKDLLVRQIAGRPEEYKRVRMCVDHGDLLPLGHYFVGGLLHVSAELITHRREQLVLEVRFTARAETCVQRGRQDRSGDRLVDRRHDRPASLA